MIVTVGPTITNVSMTNEERIELMHVLLRITHAVPPGPNNVAAYVLDLIDNFVRSEAAWKLIMEEADRERSKR